MKIVFQIFKADFQPKYPKKPTKSVLSKPSSNSASATGQPKSNTSETKELSNKRSCTQNCCNKKKSAFKNAKCFPSTTPRWKHELPNKPAKSANSSID